jgi:predicted enzyme related to lactoylglutathione lyase
MVQVSRFVSQLSQLGYVLRVPGTALRSAIGLHQGCGAAPNATGLDLERTPAGLLARGFKPGAKHMNVRAQRIPVKDRSRAIAFYSSLLGIDLTTDTSVLVFEQTGCESESPLLVDVAHRLEEVLALVWSNGGRIIEAELGSQPCALVMDCEGNRVELHGQR